jgi:hypothetical protein
VFLLCALSVLAAREKEGGSVGSHRRVKSSSGLIVWPAPSESSGSVGDSGVLVSRERHRVTSVCALRNSFRMNVIWNDLTTCATSYQVSKGSSMLRRDEREEERERERKRERGRERGRDRWRGRGREKEGEEGGEEGTG